VRRSTDASASTTQVRVAAQPASPEAYGDQRDEHEQEACEHVDDEMIRREDDRRRHCRRPDHRQRARDDVPRRPPDCDTDEQVPAAVQTRESRVLVGEPGRLQRPVRVRLERDGVDERRVDQSRGRHRKECEEEEAQATGDEDRVAEEPVALAASQKEDDPDRDDHRPVAPNVDPVRGVRQHGGPDDLRL
jgi:hypothetical protein